MIAPYFEVELVDWEQLLTSLAIMLGISGVRDIGINRRKMITILKKFRAVVFASISLFLYLFGYRQAKETAEKEQLKGENNALKIAKKARNSWSDSKRVNRLHNKYKR